MVVKVKTCIMVHLMIVRKVTLATEQVRANTLSADESIPLA